MFLATDTKRLITVNGGQQVEGEALYRGEGSEAELDVDGLGKAETQWLLEMVAATPPKEESQLTVSHQ